jgi:DNA-binding NarL/FixJ family response regulator
MTQPKKVLIIEDDAGIVFSTTLLLQRMDGVQVIGVQARGQLGIQFAIEHSVDMVILDAHLPDMNGLEVATKIRARRPHVLIVLYTGDDRLAEINPQIAQAGIDKVIHKQESLATMERKLNELLSGKFLPV